MAGHEAITVSIKKTDDDQHLVFGEVYAPDKLDSQDDFMKPETIRKMAYDFLMAGNVNKVDTNHDRVLNGSMVVESFIARDGDPDFIPGSWVIGVYIPDDTIWGLVKSGELNGFSLDGKGVRVKTEITLEIPDVLKGMTLVSKTPDGVDHEHTFIVWYDEDGNFLGGMTDEGPDGFSHKILKGTATEVSNGHSHRYSHLEGVILVHEGTTDSD